MNTIPNVQSSTYFGEQSKFGSGASPHSFFEYITPTPLESDPIALEEALDIDGVKEQHIHPEIVDGWKQRIPRSTADSIADNSDLAVRFGFGFLAGSVLQNLEHGVLSYHHGDIREYLGQLMGF